MQLPDEIPAHQLLTPDIARVIYARIAEVAEADENINEALLDIVANASKQIQQTVVDFVQAEVERSARNGRPFRLVARRP